MYNEIPIRKTVYNKEKYTKVVDREFKTFRNQETEESTDTVTELFRLYEKLFYEIPKQGETNSHRYIIERSSELVDFEKNNEDIEPLLREITELRRELLNANRRIIELESNSIREEN